MFDGYLSNNASNIISFNDFTSVRNMPPVTYILTALNRL